MKKLIQVFLAGVMVVIPFAVTIYVIWSIGGWLDERGHQLLPEGMQVPGLGAGIVIAAIFLVGLLAHFWIFRRLLAVLERLFQRVPGVKTVYESVRDLLKLFGHDSKHMGRVVLYSPPGAEISLLGILTTDEPVGIPSDPRRVAIYLPMAYMIGGAVIYVPAEHVRELDIPVEQALRLSTTAQVGAAGRKTPPTPPGNH